MTRSKSDGLKLFVWRQPNESGLEEFLFGNTRFYLEGHKLTVGRARLIEELGITATLIYHEARPDFDEIERTGWVENVVWDGCDLVVETPRPTIPAYFQLTLSGALSGDFTFHLKEEFPYVEGKYRQFGCASGTYLLQPDGQKCYLDDGANEFMRMVFKAFCIYSDPEIEEVEDLEDAPTANRCERFVTSDGMFLFAVRYDGSKVRPFIHNKIYRRKHYRNSFDSLVAGIGEVLWGAAPPPPQYHPKEVELTHRFVWDLIGEGFGRADSGLIQRILPTFPLDRSLELPAPATRSEELEFVRLRLNNRPERLSIAIPPSREEVSGSRLGMLVCLLQIAGYKCWSGDLLHTFMQLHWLTGAQEEYVRGFLYNGGVRVKEHLESVKWAFGFFRSAEPDSLCIVERDRDGELLWETARDIHRDSLGEASPLIAALVEYHKLDNVWETLQPMLDELPILSEDHCSEDDVASNRFGWLQVTLGVLTGGRFGVGRQTV